MNIFTKFKLFLILTVAALSVQAQSFNVTFRVDMSQYANLSDTVYVNGTWNSWCGRCTPMVKQGTSNIWEAVISVPSGNQEYKFTVGGWDAQESLNSSLPCTITTGGFTNRAINVTAAAVLPTVCWNSCSACSSLQPVSLPVYFDSLNVDYGLTDFGGNASEIAVDPANSSNKVVKVTKSNTAELWAGTTIGGTVGFSSAIPFASNANRMSVRVYSPDSGIAIRLKVEDPADAGKSVETEARTTTSNAWETLEFNFASQASGTAAINYTYTYKKASIFFNFGTTGATAGTKVYYFDDMMFLAPTAPVLSQIALPITFDSSMVNYTMTDFGGNTSSVVADPMNSSNKVAKVIKSNSAELWAGTTMSTPSGLALAIPFVSGSTKISIRVYSPDSGIAVRVKAEDPNDNTKSVETETMTTTSNAWEVMEFNFANQASGTAAINFSYTYKMLSVFFNFGTTGATAGEKTYYFDDVMFMGGTTPPPPSNQIKLPINFDSTNINYTMTDFGGNSSSVVADPMNSSNKVAKVIKSNTAELWAGTTMSSTPSGLAMAIPFVSGSTKLSMRVYSPDSGIAVRLKAEDPNDPTKSVETETKTTTSNAWEMMEFNFANQASGTAAINFGYTYKMLSVFFNFGTTGSTAGEKTYYFDDVVFGGGSTPPPPPTKVNVTFNVDTKNLPLQAGDTVTLNGTFNGWCGACTKMTKVTGTDTWTATVELDPKTEYEFKYVIGNWVSQETLNPSLTCTKTTSGFTNRVITTDTVNANLPLTCWEHCTPCQTGGTTKTYATFRVDMQKQGLASTDTVTLNGSFNNWCGACTPMTKVAGTDVWMATVLLDKDSSYDYKYVIGNWASQETLKEGMTCTTTKSGFTNRTLMVNKTNDTLPVVCWESCVDCQNTAPKAKVTFKVNMKNYVGDLTAGVTLNGTFNGWCGNCTPMTLIGSNIYAVTLNLDTGAYEFKYSIGNWDDQEQFSPSDLCTKTTGTFTNRYMEVTSEQDLTIGAYCWNTCTICDAVGLTEQMLSAVKLYPNPASDNLFIDFGQVPTYESTVGVYSILGERILTKNSSRNYSGNGLNLDISGLKPGVYIVKIEMNQSVKTLKLQVQ
ncbi:MAG: T9SS type A sorting domain-containing protein [Bacteroidia bacterium]|nr:T9SS type A sorting domain-containing protein [Bacteroidia bacterium]MCF8428158.1 T9SS type A sorting domain-containing protein [Bacteroidia bacterium]MCF8447368.1 T9SS type A sorting domain-containing protein [Bacteroidia bacterium]